MCPADVVYVGVLQFRHLELSSIMLKGGKHVLCEKPLCINVKQTRQLLDVARQSRRFLMEVSLWVVSGPATRKGHASGSLHGTQCSCLWTTV